MSNTAVVTPIASSATGGSLSAAAGVVGACALTAAAAVAVAWWLVKEHAKDRAVLDRLDAKRFEELLARGELDDLMHQIDAPPITTVNLHTRDTGSLVRAAEQLGYRREPLVGSLAPLAKQATVLLQRPTGERLVIGRSSDGGVALRTPGDRPLVDAVVRQRTVELLSRHVSRKGMRAQSAQLPGGEVEFIAGEQGAPRRGGNARLKLHVRANGAIDVDVACVRGNRCAEIVSEVADAVGGTVVKSVKKDAFFQLPGEPAKTKVRV